MRKLFRCLTVILIVAAVPLVHGRGVQRPAVVLDNVRIIDGTGAAPIERGRVVIRDDASLRSVRWRQLRRRRMPSGSILRDSTIVPGLIDLHFHIENDPKLALRQLSHGVTAFRDPGQWDEKFVELRAHDCGRSSSRVPAIFTTGPHIDGEHPAYPADSVVARDPEEARRLRRANVRNRGVGAENLFPAAVREREGGDRCLRGAADSVHRAPRDARRARAVRGRPARHRARHLARHERAAAPRGAKRTGRRCSPTTTRGATADTELFARADLDGPEAQALYAVLRARKPWLDPTLAVFERRVPTGRRGRPRTPAQSR